MINKSLIHPHFYLSLSLAIASTLVTSIAKAEATQPTPNVNELSQKIAKLIDLDPDRQSLITSALNRAIASKDTPTETDDKIKTTTPQPTIRGRYAKPISTPQPTELGYMAKPKDKVEKTDVPNNNPNRTVR
jgi:hypothetical protein